MRRFILWTLFLTAMPVLIAVCDTGTEPATVELPVVTEAAGLSAFTNAEGYTIELSACRVALRDLEFTIGGETHARLFHPLGRLALPVAHAHPGHYAGGEVTGELPGRFVFDPFAESDRPLGNAILLEGQYRGINFYFRKADAGDDLPPGDPLLGHTVYLAGRAQRSGVSWDFEAVLDMEDGTQMVGGPFALEVRPGSTATLVLRLLPVDPSTEAKTLFDGIDFASLDADGDSRVRIAPGDQAHNRLRRRFQAHDHWWMSVRHHRE